MGASALVSTYYHSCFRDIWTGKQVYDMSSTSFLGLWGEKSAHASGYNKTVALFRQFSQTIVKLVGGAAATHGVMSYDAQGNPTGEGFGALEYIAPSNRSLEILRSYRVYPIGFDCMSSVTPRAPPPAPSTPPSRPPRATNTSAKTLETRRWPSGRPSARLRKGSHPTPLSRLCTTGKQKWRRSSGGGTAGRRRDMGFELR